MDRLSCFYARFEILLVNQQSEPKVKWFPPLDYKLNILIWIKCKIVPQSVLNRDQGAILYLIQIEIFDF